MERARFDFLTRTLAASSSRRTALKGLASLALGGLASRTGTSTAEAAWSTLVCLPVGSEVTARLVPTASVPFYVQRYGAVVAEHGVCECLTTAPCPVFTTCSGGACVDPCTLLDCSCPGPLGGCLRYADGSADCIGPDWEFVCTEAMANCTSDAICVTEAGPGFRCAIAEEGATDDCFGYPNTCQRIVPKICSA